VLYLLCLLAPREGVCQPLGFRVGHMETRYLAT